LDVAALLEHDLKYKVFNVKFSLYNFLTCRKLPVFVRKVEYINNGCIASKSNQFWIFNRLRVSIKAIKMKAALIIAVNLFILSTVRSQQCIQSVKNMANLNITRFATGRWYVYKSSMLYGQLGVSCAYGQFKNSTRGRFTVNYMLLNAKRSDIIPYNRSKLGFDVNISVPVPVLNFNITMTVKVR
jgi:hypothetical protein